MSDSGRRRHELFEFCFRHGMRGGWAFAQVRLVHVLALQCSEKRPCPSSSSARRIVPCSGRRSPFGSPDNHLLCLPRTATLSIFAICFFSSLVSCPQAGLFLPFSSAREDRCGFIARFDQLAPTKILFRVVEGVKNHALRLARPSGHSWAEPEFQLPCRCAAHGRRR